MQDSQIVESVLAGNTQAFEFLVLKYQKQLYHTAYGITKNPASAEDIAQESFVKAYEKLNTLQNHAGFYAWVKKIAINMALNLYDRNKWNVDVTTDLEGENFFDKVATYETPEDRMLKEELKQYINMFIDSLPDKLRLVLVLREIDELSYEEISEMLDIPIGTVRSRLFNARQILKERLVKQGLADGIYDKQES